MIWCWIQLIDRKSAMLGLRSGEVLRLSQFGCWRSCSHEVSSIGVSSKCDAFLFSPLCSCQCRAAWCWRFHHRIPGFGSLAIGWKQSECWVALCQMRSSFLNRPRALPLTRKSVWPLWRYWALAGGETCSVAFTVEHRLQGRGSQLLL